MLLGAPSASFLPLLAPMIELSGNRLSAQIRGFSLLQRITREKINPPSARRNVWENDQSLPMGIWVIWWYGRLVKNFAAETVPLVEVTLQKLDGDRVTESPLVP